VRRLGARNFHNMRLATVGLLCLSACEQAPLKASEGARPGQPAIVVADACKSWAPATPADLQAFIVAVSAAGPLVLLPLRTSHDGPKPLVHASVCGSVARWTRVADAKSVPPGLGYETWLLKQDGVRWTVDSFESREFPGLPAPLVPPLPP
jgi:hypothetical protein